MASIFLDENSIYRESEQNLNQIVIAGIRGILKEPLKFSVESEWEPIFNLADRYQTVQAGMSLLTGSRLFNTGVWTKRLWKGGSYLRINPVIRIVDWDGTGNVVRDVERLMDLALPVYKSDKGVDDITRIKRDLSPIVEGLSNVPAAALDLGKDLVTGELSPRKLAEGAIDGFSKAIKGISSKGPQPVSVTISNFFYNTFIVEQVEAEFSKEMTKSGPLYADLNMTLATQEVTVKGDTGLKTRRSPKVGRKK